jgi:hypothetical protein
MAEARAVVECTPRVLDGAARAPDVTVRPMLAPMLMYTPAHAATAATAATARGRTGRRLLGPFRVAVDIDILTGSALRAD